MTEEKVEIEVTEDVEDAPTLEELLDREKRRNRNRRKARRRKLRAQGFQVGFK